MRCHRLVVGGGSRLFSVYRSNVITARQLITASAWRRSNIEVSYYYSCQEPSKYNASISRASNPRVASTTELTLRLRTVRLHRRRHIGSKYFRLPGCRLSWSACGLSDFGPRPARCRVFRFQRIRSRGLPLDRGIAVTRVPYPRNSIWRYDTDVDVHHHHGHFERTRF